MPIRNAEVSLNELPQVNIQRSIFHRNFGHKTSFNVGELIPFYVDEVIAGDSHNITTSIVARLQTLLTPVMDNIYLDTFYFYCPFRILLDHWPQMCGENDKGPWTMDKINYQIPYLTYPNDHVGVPEEYLGGFDSGSLADYFGVPIHAYFEDADIPNVNNKNFPSALPFRAYAMIVNEFFRDTNYQQPIVVHTDDSIRKGKCRVDAGTDWYVTDLELGGKPFVAARFHDYFSSCLPAPQRSEPISIFGNFINEGTFAPVGPRTTNHNPLPSYTALKMVGDSVSLGLVSKNTDGTLTMAGSAVNAVYPANLWANLNIPEATISNLRMAFQLQKYYEKSARAGDRYRSYLQEFFGVDNGDGRLQIPEYLGGHRIPLSIHQVANTSQSADGDLGDVGAMSNTSDIHEDFHMSFTEAGLIIGLCCVRYDNTYSQGLERMWSRRDILDFYNPVFAAISDQPVYKREIAFGDEQVFSGVDEVWGYAPAWQDYRVKPNRVSGEMRPEAPNSLASWHLSDSYRELPTFDGTWIQTDKDIVDRVLAVGSDVANQVFCDIYVQNECVRPMPMYGIPGLADHF